MNSRKNKVLIVEDDRINMELMKDVLHPAGFTTVATRDGRKAIQMVRKHNPDLIVMDINLGEISGLDLTVKLKRDDELKHIPIIAVTAFAMKGDKEKCVAAGCDAYISKPIGVADFLYMVNKLIG